MISKKMWIKEFKAELFWEFPEKYYVLKYLPQMVVRKVYGALTPREVFNNVLWGLIDFCIEGD